MLLRRKRRLGIEGPAEAPGEDPVTEADGETLDMEMRDGVYQERRRWWQRKPKIEFVTLERLEWDGERYILRRETVARDDLPREAVHVTGMKKTYFLDLVDRSTRDDLNVQWDPSHKIPDAIDLYLYAINNSISDALLIRSKAPPMDVKRILIVVTAIAVVACVAWVFIGPMLR